MWPFDKWFKKTDGRMSYDQIVEGYSNISKAGININPMTALQCSTVLACVRVIANGISQIPFKLYRLDGKQRNPATRHPLFDLLTNVPNDFQTSYEFRQMIALHLCLTGNAYIWINRVDGRIVELLPYPPNTVSINRNNWEVTYGIHLQSGKWITVPASDMWHIRWLSYDGVAGLSSVQLARDTIGLSLALENYGSNTFRNGARLSGILTLDHKLDQEQRKSLKEAWEAAFTGPDNDGKVAVLGADMKWQQLSSTNDSAQFIESRKHQIEEICRAFGVPPIMIGYSDKASTYASAEQMFLSHVVHTMSPWYANIEQSANKALLSKNERKAGYYFKFNVNALLRGATIDRAEFYTKLYNIGALSPNEIRELEDLNPYPNGDEYRVPLNMERPGEHHEEDEAEVEGDNKNGRDEEDKPNGDKGSKD